MKTIKEALLEQAVILLWNTEYAYWSNDDIPEFFNITVSEVKNIKRAYGIRE